MKEYHLSALVTISIETKVTAETLEEAILTASQRHIEVYNWSDKEQNKDCWVSEEFDGEPYEIKEI